MALDLAKVDTPLNKETKQNQTSHELNSITIFLYKDGFASNNPQRLIYH